MPSTFTWVDFEEKDRYKMLEVIKMFQETDTRDELGIGTIRDAIAELFFPGTTTIQTRAKYMLFIPWIYKLHEERRTPSNQISNKVWEDEITLINALKQSEDTDGIIGGVSGKDLQRMPSSVYWNGLWRWGIRKFYGSVEELHRYFDDYHKEKENVVRDDDKEAVAEFVREIWHSGLPEKPKTFPDEASFKLKKEQAEYLADRIMHNCENTLLAYLVREENRENANYIWEHPDFGQFPEHFKNQIIHARNFALSINGAALLYNLMLAEKRQDEERQETYTQYLGEWANSMDAINFLEWDLVDFWGMVEAVGRVPVRTRRFVDEWIELACESGMRHKVNNNDEARSLITERERMLKGSRARLENQRALELWSGAAGTRMLSYRWEIAKDMINDISNGLQEE